MREGEIITTFMCRMSWKSGSLNLLEPSGPHRACYGTALSYIVYIYVCVCVCVCERERERDLETSTMRQPSPDLGCSASEKVNVCKAFYSTKKIFKQNSIIVYGRNKDVYSEVWRKAMLCPV